MNSFSKSIDDNNILFEQFLGDNNSEEELEYDETFLEQLINQNSILLDAENIESNKQSNIFHIENFLWAHETVRSEEINEYNSSSDDEIDDDNEQNLKNESESLENEIYIMDEMSTSLSPCAIVDMIDGKLQTCGNNSKRCISQLIGTWQIDTSIAAQFLDGKVNLGVCMSHFNYDQKNHMSHAKQIRKTEKSIIHRRKCFFCEKYYYFFSRGMNCRQHSWNIFNRNIQVACNGQFSCNALEVCPNISNLANEEFSDPRYICCSCFETNGGHIHRKNGSGKPKFNCENDRLHDEDSDKILIALANWLLLVVKNESQDRKEIILTHMLNPALHFLQNITLSKNTKKNIDMESICNFEEIRRSSISSTTSTISSINTVYTGLTNYIQLPTLFMFQILLKMNKISNTISSELLISDEQWPDVGNKLAERIWKSREELNKQKAEIQNPASLENYYSAFPSYLTGFFGNLCGDILKKKLEISNRKSKSRNKLLKQFDEQQLIKIVTFFVSVLIGIAFSYLQVWFTQVLSSLSRKPKLNQQFRRLLSTLQISGHTDGQERKLEKVRMKSINPCQRLNKSENIWNLGVIDNIDFKEATFRYGNIFDTTRTSTHTTLRMVFQHQMPFNLYENKNDENQNSSPLELFGMNQMISNTLDIFDSVLDNLLNVQINSQGIAIYQTNFDMAIIHDEILNRVEHGCKVEPPNVVILEPGGVPNSDEEQYLDVVADEAIFRRIIKLTDQWPYLRPILGQWHTSKDMCSVLIVLFSSYGIFDLANSLGVKFLEKLESVVDYRSTHEIWENANLALQIWYLYYQWAGIFKAHRIGIRVGNYDLQKNALAAFGGLFASAAKTRYASSVCHFLGILEKFPKLEDKLRYAASIKIDDNEKRKGHFFAYDEALETFGVKFIKQNITGNVVNMENLKMQIKSVQTERNRIEILLSEYLNDPTASTGNHAINQRYDAMWNLVKILLQEFDQTNESFLNSNTWKNVYRSQLTVEGVIQLKNCFSDGIVRMQAIYYEDVLKTRPTQPGRSKLGTSRLKILNFQKELKEAKKNKKTMEHSQTMESRSQPQEESSDQRDIIMQEQQENETGNKRKRKAKRIPSLEEETLLEPLILSQSEPTNEEMREKLNTLSDEWDLSRIKQHVQYRRKKRAVENAQ
ncbi:unnamed protein product [Rhizophagus irregularis]|nr:unnamed protein product [Rhizophagus irregularis]